MTSGNPIKKIINFAIPILVSTLISHLYTLADTAIVGRYLGENAFAAVGASSTIIYFIFATFGALCNGCSIITAQKYGAKDAEGIKRSVASCYTIAGVTALLIMAIVIPLLPYFLGLLKTPEGEIFEDSKRYLLILFLGLPISAVANVVATSIRAFGDSLTPTFSLIVSAVLNVGLNILFIIKLGMGVEGVALATVIAQLFATATIYAIGIRKHPQLAPGFKYWKNELISYWNHLRIAIPMALQFQGTAIGFVMLQSALNIMGKDTINTYTIGVRTEQFLGSLFAAIGASIATFVAQNYGAGLYSRIRLGIKQITIVIVILTVLASLILTFGSEVAINLFLDEASPELYPKVKMYLRVSAVLYICLTLLYVHRNTLQGLGKAFVPLVSGIMELIARVCCSLYVIQVVKETKALFGTIDPLEAAADVVEKVTASYNSAFWGISLANPLSWLLAEVVLIVAYIVAMRRLGEDKPVDKSKA